MNPEVHSSGNGPQQRGAPDNSTRLANGLFALAVAGAFLIVLLLAVRNAAPPGYGKGTTALWLHPSRDAPGGPTNCPADQ